MSLIVAISGLTDLPAGQIVLDIARDFGRHWILYCTWAGLFVVTVFLLRMLYTRWGESNVTSKAVSLSLLIHLVAGLWTTTVKMAASSSQDTTPERRIVLREVRIEKPQSPLSSSSTTPFWQQPIERTSQPIQRVQKEQAEAAPLSAPREQRTESVIAMKTPSLSLPSESMTSPAARNDATSTPRAVNGAKETIQENTAEARADQQLRGDGPARQSRTPAGTETAKVERASRPGMAEQIAVRETPQSGLVIAPLPESPKATTRIGQDLRPSERTAPRPAANVPIEEGSPVTSPATATGSGEPNGSRFSRVGRQAPTAGPSTAAPSMRAARDPAAIVGDGAMAFNPRAGVSTPVLEGLPPVARQEISAVLGAAASKMPATYRLRSLPQRRRVAMDLGASEESEQAVELALRWLAAHQNPEGYWDPDGFTVHCPPGRSCQGEARHGSDPTETVNSPERQNSGITADSGVTALTILAYLGAGQTPLEGPHADTVDRALRWLISQQTKEGFLGGNSSRYARMYCHGMATIALGEAYGMTGDQSLREPLALAVQFILDNQLSDGGWRYDRQSKAGDMSLLGWQLMALRSAAVAGVPVPRENVQLATDFLTKSAQGDHGGLAGYGGFAKDIRVRPSMTAEAQYCRQILAQPMNARQSQEAIGYLMQYPPRRADYDLYYWYYGTLAMYHQQDKRAWGTWNRSLQEILIADQRTDGHAAGSWDPHTPWGDYGGRVFSTAMSTLCLEVYYRFLPLYQMGNAPSSNIKR